VFKPIGESTVGLRIDCVELSTHSFRAHSHAYGPKPKQRLIAPTPLVSLKPMPQSRLWRRLLTWSVGAGRWGGKPSHTVVTPGDH